MSPRSKGALIAVGRAAKMIGVHRETVKRWVARGTLASREIHGRTYVFRAEVEALIRPPDQS